MSGRRFHDGDLRKTAALAVVLCWLAVAVGAAAQEGAAADTTSTGGGLADLVDQAADAAPDTSAFVDEPSLLLSWTRSPSAAFTAGLRSIGYSGGFDNTFVFGDRSRLTQTLDVSHEDYRTQEKLVDKRDMGVNYVSDSDRTYRGSLNMMSNWSEDALTSSSGQTTVNKRDYKQARATLNRDPLTVAGTEHQVSFNGVVSNQAGEMQNQRNDFSEASLDGAVRSSWKPREWLSMRTGYYTMTESGERTLGEETNPSSATGDTLRAGASYGRGRFTGGFNISTASFEKRYLDYHRNSNGVVDTIGVTQKIVEELERNDAVTFEWINDLDLGRAKLHVRMARDLSENAYRISGIGTKEKRQDSGDVTLGLRVTRRDSMHVSYRYLWRWDDQRYKGATLNRGRQINNSHTVGFSWVHNLFEHTDLKLSLNNGITQDIAEHGFNKNDRDRIDTSGNLKLDTVWDNGVVVGLVLDARQVEDVSIRRSRSGNNSIKETYEISPGYSWPVGSWVDVGQTYRMWIQYTDYVFSEMESVRKEDDFNKRGNMETRVTLRPNSRLDVTLTHNYNIKLNGKRTRTDAAGNDFYFRESDQRVNKIDVSLSYKAARWLQLKGTTLKSRDYKQTFGTTIRETERYSGDVALGCLIDKNMGDGKLLKATVRKIFAYGPNIQAAGEDYWDADIQFSWRF